MASFDPSEDLQSDPDFRDFRLLSDGPVTLFWRTAVLDETVQWLHGRGYQVTRLDASTWNSAEDLHRDIAAALSFPDYYGDNFDALVDCMRDVVDRRYGWPLSATGLVLIFAGYERFAASCPRDAQMVLDIMADQSRCAALVGLRLICLVQSNDPNVTFKPVGATPVAWNPAEWTNASRR